MSENEILLNSETYNDFIRCMSNLVRACDDVDIHGGILRQRNNSNTFVLEMDLRSIFDDIDLSISDMKNKFELLKTFQGQDVTLKLTEESVEFSDKFSKLQFLNPSMEYMNNKFMPDAEKEKTFFVEEEDLIFEKELSSIITERIRTTAKIFNVFAIQVEMNGDKASICASTPSRDQRATFMKNIDMNMEFEECSANLSTIPFTLDHDTDINFQFFKSPKADNISYSYFSTNLGEIDIKIYARTAIVRAE